MKSLYAKMKTPSVSSNISPCINKYITYLEIYQSINFISLNNSFFFYYYCRLYICILLKFFLILYFISSNEIENDNG